MSPRCPCHPPTCPHATASLPARPGPHHAAGMGAGAGGWMTPPAWTGRAGRASWGVSLPGPRVPARLLPPSWASPSQAPLEGKEPSGKAVKQGPRCSTPSVPPQRNWTGEVSSGCFSQPQDTRFSLLFTDKTSSKETSAQGPGFFTEPFTITRASTLDQSLSAGMQNPCFFPHPM